MSPYPLLLTLTLGVLALPSTARAQEAISLARPEVNAYAIIIGNNAGGPGQEDLHYAEADARRVSAVLVELGGYSFQEPHLLFSPSPVQLWNTFEEVQKELTVDAASGQESVLFFYYSGHARSKALDLGAHQVELSDLRARIEAMPASLRVVVLDACQSGAISRVKGAKPAADFSTSSIASLSMQGLAIMASSTGAELSQESDALEGSYFTHHLVSGLRGAADNNRDGSVTLSEAYAYAYDATLLATAVSAVGKQHVTLETDLRGKGDVALTRPAEANARLIVPARVTGALTISHRGSVVVEANKVAGQPIMLALPTGRYSVIVRQTSRAAKECHANLRGNEAAVLDLGLCKAIRIDAGVRKGGPSSQMTHSAGPSFIPQWSVELNLGLRGSSTSSYTNRLETFGYERADDFMAAPNYNIKAYRSVGPHLQIGASVGTLESGHYRRHTDGASTYDLSWTTHQLSALARAYHRYDGGRSEIFAEASLGFSVARSRLHEEEMDRISKENDYGYAIGGALGASWMAFRRLGLVATLGYGYAPTLDNELGESHSGTGLVTNFGLRSNF